MAKRIPGKEEFQESIRYFTNKVQQLRARGNLELFLGQEITSSDIEEKNGSIDKWIVATGVEPRSLSIPGINHPNVLSYVDVLRSNKVVGRKVAIIGAGGIGFDVAEFLLHPGPSTHPANPDNANVPLFLSEWGVDSMYNTRGGLLLPESVVTNNSETHVKRELYLLQRKKGKLGSGLGKTTGWIHRSSLLNSKCVEMLDAVSYDKVDENGFLHITRDGKKRILETDNIVICAGQVSKRDLTDNAHSQWKDKVFTIGGANEALELDAKRAIDMGTRLALKISEVECQKEFDSIKRKIGSEEKMFQLFRQII
jgi:2,4-dienoyl-CoA reductase (NADPH2)